MAKSLLILLKNLQQMHLKLLAKEQFEKQLKQSGDLLDNIIANKITSISKKTCQ